jgi:hypothetical protein
MDDRFRSQLAAFTKFDVPAEIFDKLCNEVCTAFGTFGSEP